MKVFNNGKFVFKLLGYSNCIYVSTVWYCKKMISPVINEPVWLSSIVTKRKCTVINVLTWIVGHNDIIAVVEMIIC